MGKAEITRLKDGRTALAYKAEQAVDMESGAILAITTHAGAAADTETLQQTVCDAGVAVSELLQQTSVHAPGVQEVIADKGYHSNDTVAANAGLGPPHLHRRTATRTS